MLKNKLHIILVLVLCTTYLASYPQIDSLVLEVEMKNGDEKFARWDSTSGLKKKSLYGLHRFKNNTESISIALFSLSRRFFPNSFNGYLT